MSVSSGDRGMTLLEVVAALAILALAGLALLERVGEATRQVADAADRDRALAVEERLLVTYTLLARGDLDRRIGQHTQGDLTVSVQRPRRSLYRIAVGANPNGLEDLITVVYRPDSLDAR
jgi:prepilin-type N-terminal cleavage/methylation domain-containing protein